ncbi:hypothetical protein BHE74_00000557 [Ensete ventricosum]|nr:hypothetical protein BHE74_00000557 [Ensete ventricosum]
MNAGSQGGNKKEKVKHSQGEEIDMADERPPAEGGVELHVGLQVPLLARQPREHHHDPLPPLLTPPVEPPPVPPHLLRSKSRVSSDPHDSLPIPPRGRRTRFHNPTERKPTLFDWKGTRGSSVEVASSCQAEVVRESSDFSSGEHFGGGGEAKGGDVSSIAGGMPPFSKRVPFPIPGCDFYTRRSVIVRTFALSVVGVLERGGCMVASSTEASYTGSTVGLACTTSFIYGRSSSTVGVTP